MKGAGVNDYKGAGGNFWRRWVGSLSEVMVLRDTYVETHPIMHFKYVQFIVRHDTSIQLF